MRILIVTDAWLPQVNGVVRTLNAVIRELVSKGHDVHTINPEGRPSRPLPFYREISLTRITAGEISAEIARVRPDAIHIATEGPLGWAARRACLRDGLKFTTGFHTRFAEYAAKRAAPSRRAQPWMGGAAALSCAERGRDGADEIDRCRT